jgi:hypothetical protein
MSSDSEDVSDGLIDQEVSDTEVDITDSEKPSE